MHANVLALVASASTALAVSQGFNYGAANSDGSFRFQDDFQREFALAKSLPGTDGFTSARLYTMIQGGSSTNEPISAIPAAIAEGTTLLLGLWGSGGDGFFSAEITALRTAIQQYGSAFTDLVVGISVGSEDLYRISPTGIAANSGYGANPDTLARYVAQLREAIRGTPLANAPVGHVDTWTAWVNGSNQAVIDAVDWVGVNAFPYFENTLSNSVQSGAELYESALSQTRNAVGGKEMWLTETGWPVSGKTENLAVPSPENAKVFWDTVGCPRFGNVNMYWYTLQDATPTVPNPSFGIVGSDGGAPLFDLSCDAPTSTSSASASTATASNTASSAASGLSSVVTSAIATGGASSAVVNPPASSGGALGPSQGGEVIVPSLTQGAGPAPTNATGPVTQTTVVVGTGGATATGPSPTTSPILVGEGAASSLSASFVGAFIALFAAAMAL